jgi:hypothetical protein
MRKRYLRVAAIYHHALEAGVGEDDALVAAVAKVYSKKVKRSDIWRLDQGRYILRQLEKSGTPSVRSPNPQGVPRCFPRT